MERLRRADDGEADHRRDPPYAYATLRVYAAARFDVVEEAAHSRLVPPAHVRDEEVGEVHQIGGQRRDRRLQEVATQVVAHEGTERLH
eukprot:2295108-Prymnesium_polylepis.1